MTTKTPVRKKPPRITITLDWPVIDDAAAVAIYNFLCELTDRFDDHYGEQICRFYAQYDAIRASRNSTTVADDPPF